MLCQAVFQACSLRRALNAVIVVASCATSKENSVCGCALTLVLRTDCGIVLNPDEDLLLEGDLGIHLTRHVMYYFLYGVLIFFYIVS